MKVQIVKRKASSLKELGKEVIEIPEVSTLKELLIIILYHEYNTIYHKQMRALQKEEIEQFAKLGKVSFSMLYNKDKKALDEHIEVMLQDFQDGLYRVYINKQEYQNLDDQLLLKENDEIVFIRFVMLAGRLW